MAFLVIWLAAWIIPVIVLFRKGQNAWAVTGILFGWAFAIVWIIAALTTENRPKAAAVERRHTEMISSMRPAVPHLPVALPPPVAETVEDRFESLGRLLSDGTITPVEFSVARRNIIEGI